MKNGKFAWYRLFTVLSVSFFIGLLVASYTHIVFERVWLVLLIFILALLFSSLINFLLKNYFLVIASFSLIALVFGLGYYSFFDKEKKVDLVYDQNMTVEGKIIRRPDVNYSRQQVVIRAESIDGKPVFSDTLLLVKLPHFPRLYYGDRIKFEGETKKPGKIEDFDYGKYLKRYLIFGTIDHPKNIHTLESRLGAKDKLVKSLYLVSSQFEDSLNRVLPEPHASLASGILLGIKRNIPEGLSEELNSVGLTHIVALSGYNITIIILIVSEILMLSLGRKQVFFISLALILAFVVMTGASSSVVRASIFSLMILFGRTIGRRGDQTNLMLLAALIMTLQNPYILANDLGFQLSFTAFAGLIYISPIISKIIEMTRIREIPDGIKLPLRETLSAQLAVAPLILTNFGRISLIAPLANLFVLWILPLVMALIFITGVLGIIVYPLGKIGAVLLWPCLEYIIRITSSLSKVPLASLQVEDKLFLWGICLYIVLLVVSIMLLKKFKLKIV